MSVDRQQLKRIFGTAIELPPDQRARFLDDSCRGDERLRAEVESLLQSYDRAGDFMERPPTAGAAALVALVPHLGGPQFAAGHRLGPYEILEPLGSGGMGEVYRARDVRLDRIVALKVLHRAVARDAEARRRFEHEARTISKLNHPNICALYDVGRHEDIEFLVMEHLEGETLTATLARGALPRDLLLRYAVDIADALDRAHRHGVIHRDLKPSNIILTEAGAKLLDFGIAKLHRAGPEPAARASADSAGTMLTGGGRLPGTAAYMSPEQLTGGAVDARADLFALGAVLYEMASGRRAFPGDTTAAIRSAILDGTAPHASTLTPPLDPELCRIIDRALERDRERRYQSAAELKADIERVASRLASRRPPAGSRRVRLGAAAAIAAALGAGVFVVNARRPPSVAPRSIAVLPFKPLGSVAAGDEYLGVALADALITELDAFRTVAVRPLSASLRFGANSDPLAAGRELGADLVLDGAIQRAGDRLRVSVALVRVSDRVTVWSDRFDSAWIDVFQVQDAIADHVGRALAVALTGEERQRMTSRRTHNVDAYEAYLKGRYFWNMRTAAGFQRALDYFQRAIAADPVYAPAYAGLADTYALLGSMPYAVMRPLEASGRARDAATRALEIDPTLAEAQVSLAFVTYSFDWDWARGEEGFKRAIELDPDYATARYWYSLYLGQVGRLDEALAQAQRAMDLEPLSLVGTYAVGLAHYYARRMDLATSYANKSLEISPAFPPGLRLLGSVRLAEGRITEGIAPLRRLFEAAPENTLHAATLAYAHGLAGQRAEAEAIIHRMLDSSRDRFVPAADVAMAYVGLGDRDVVFHWFEKAFEEHSQALTFLKIDPMFDSLREDPRYADLARRIGLAP